MKNETARREIESLDYYLQNHTNDYSEESHTAMMMAIKALEQTQLADGDRAVSLNAVLSEIGRWIGYLDEDMIMRIQIGIKKLPSVSPQDGEVVWRGNNFNTITVKEDGD